MTCQYDHGNVCNAFFAYDTVRYFQYVDTLVFCLYAHGNICDTFIALETVRYFYDGDPVVKRSLRIESSWGSKSMASCCVIEQDSRCIFRKCASFMT